MSEKIDGMPPVADAEERNNNIPKQNVPNINCDLENELLNPANNADNVEQNNVMEIPPLVMETEVEIPQNAEVFVAPAPIDQSHQLPAKPNRFGTPFITDKPLCLMVEDVQNIEFKDNYVFSFYGHDFKRVMIHGHVIPYGAKYNKTFRTYKIDDGTSSIDVYFSQNGNEYLATVTGFANLVNELEAAEKQNRLLVNNNKPISSSSSIESLFESMKILENTIKSRLDKEFVKGEKAFVIGQPFKSARGKIMLWSNDMYADNAVNRDAEILWKRHLCKFYKDIIKNI